jgi:predicted phage terminase large subunit-like protein
MSDLQNKFDELFENECTLKALQLACLAEFKIYIKVIFFALNRRSFTFKDFHNIVIGKLQDIADRSNAKRNLMLNLPVGSGKSLLVELFITWCFARDINAKFCYVSHSDKLINKLSGETKEIVESREWLALFGHQIKKDERSKTEYSFEGAGNRTGLSASSIGGAITGVDAGNPNVDGGDFPGALLVDDPLDVNDANSEVVKQEVIRLYTDKLKTRLRTPQTPVIVIAQRLAVDDLPSYIIENEADEYDIVSVKAHENGQSYWPEKISAEVLSKMSVENAVLYHSQYQQEPVIAGGNLFKKEMVEIGDLPELFDYSFITADTAYKEKQENDFTAFTAWGLRNKQAYILDIFRQKISSDRIEGFIIPFAKRFQAYGFRGLFIEPKGHGIYLNQKLPKLDITMPPPLEIDEFFKDRRMDKVARANAVIPYLAYNKITINRAIPEDLRNQCTTELLNFPKGKNDDFTDTFIDGVKYIHTHPISILDVL